MLPTLSTNLKNIAICSFLDSSCASWTIMKNLVSPISTQVWLLTFLEKMCKFSFWIWWKVYFTLYGAFSNTTGATLSLYDARSLIISRNLPLLLDYGVFSWSLKAQTWNASQQIVSIGVLSCKWLLQTCSKLWTFIMLLMCKNLFNRSSQAFIALLFGK